MADEQAAGQTIELPGMYFNGFQIGITNSDVSGVMLLNGQPQAVLNMSYTTAKSLATALNELIARLESATGRPIMITKEVDRVLSGSGSSGEPK
jgi:hypothetical protein